jgi:hypothetical protein
MARRVDAFPEVPSQSKYPWDEWLDGSVWELAPGDDFQGKPATFRSVAIGQAKKRGGKVKTRLIRSKDPEQRDKLYIRFERDDGQQQGYGRG